MSAGQRQVANKSPRSVALAASPSSGVTWKMCCTVRKSELCVYRMVLE